MDEHYVTISAEIPEYMLEGIKVYAKQVNISFDKAVEEAVGRGLCNEAMDAVTALILKRERIATKDDINKLLEGIGSRLEALKDEVNDLEVEVIFNQEILNEMREKESVV